MSQSITPSDSYLCRGDSVAHEEDLTPPDEPLNGLAAIHASVQRNCLRIVGDSRFDNVVLALVMLNSICLACDDPTDLHPERQNIVDICETVFLSLFTVELILKVLAYGCSAESGYLSAGWNRLDALIVFLGYLEVIVGDSAGGMSALRCFRCLRPLRTINRLPQLKVIINTLVASTPQLFHVVQLCSFVYLMFALIGLQIWYNGVLHRNCVSSSTGSVLLDDDDGLQMCNAESDAVLSCPAGYQCIHLFDTPRSSTLSFDNIGTSLMIAFLVASVESWTNVVVYMEDSATWGELWMVMIWFVVVVLIGGGLCMNLPPAVLKACFSDTASQTTSNNANVRIVHQRLNAARASQAYELSESRRNSLNKNDERRDSAAVHPEPAEVSVIEDNVLGCVQEDIKEPHSQQRHPISVEPVHSVGKEALNSMAEAAFAGLLSSQDVTPGAADMPESEPLAVTAGAVDLPGLKLLKRSRSNELAAAAAELRAAEEAAAAAVAQAAAELKAAEEERQRRAEVRHKRDSLEYLLKDAEEQCTSIETPIEDFADDHVMKMAEECVSSETPLEDFVPLPPESEPPTCSTAGTGSGCGSGHSLSVWANEVTGSLDGALISASQQCATGCGTGSGTGAEQLEQHPQQHVFDNSTPVEVFDSKDSEVKPFSDAKTIGVKTLELSTPGATDVQQKEEAEEETVNNMYKSESTLSETDVVPPPACENQLSRICHKLVLHIHFANLFFLLISLNTIVLTIDGNDLNADGDFAMDILNWTFTVAFTVEMFMKIIAFGKLYFKDSLNIFDFVIVVVSWLEIGIRGGGSSSTSVLRMLRVLRLARLLKIIRMSRSIAATRIILTVLVAMLPTLQYIGLLVMLMTFVFAILGMGLFGGQMSEPNEGVPDSNFDHFGWAFLTTFQLVTLEDWPVVFENVKNATNWASIIYVLAVIITGNFVLLKLMLAIMLAFFEDPDMAAEITNQDNFLTHDGRISQERSDSWLDPVPDEIEAPTTKHLVDDPDYEEELVENEDSDKAVETDTRTVCETYRADGCMAATRQFSLWIVVQRPFTLMIEMMIVANCCFMAVDPNQEVTVLVIIDIVFTGVFVMEQLLKILAHTFPIYARDAANKLDMFVVLISLFSLCFSGVDIGFVKAIRAVRVIRPLRLVIRSEGMMLVASSLLQSLPGMLNVMVVCLMAWLVFGILGMEFFKDLSSGFCSNSSILEESECTGYHFNEYDTLVLNRWYETDAKFSNTIVTWLTLFQVSSLEGWVDVMYFYVLHPDSSYAAALFFVLWVIISNWFLVNLCVGVIWINYQAICEKHQGWAFLTESQREWVTAQRRALLLEPARSVLRPYRVNAKARLCYDISTHRIYRHFISCNIILNVVTIALTHYEMSQTWKDAIIIANFFFSCNFFIEAMLKIAGFKWQGYWRDGWNRFEFILALYVFGDLAVMIINLLPDVDIPDSGPINLLLKMVILTRCLRVIRLMKNLRGVTTMLYTLYRALPAVGNIGLLLCVLLYMYAVAGVILFQDVLRRGGLTHSHNFEHFGNSCWTIFLICTGDIWPDMMYNCMYTGSDCSDSEGNCGTPVAAIYFVSLVSMVTFLLLNMFVTILVDQFIEARRVFMGRVNMDDLDKFRKMWSFYDREGLGYIAPHHLSILLIELPEPLGLGADEDERCDLNFMRGLSLKIIAELELTDFEGKAHFAQVLFKLSERAHREDMSGIDKETLFNMVSEQESRVIPTQKEELRNDGFKNTIDERLAASVVIRHIWRKNYINKLRRGIIPSNISCDFKLAVLQTEESRKAACQTLLKVCHIVWHGFPESLGSHTEIDMRSLKWGSDGLDSESDKSDSEPDKEDEPDNNNNDDKRPAPTSWFSGRRNSPVIPDRRKSVRRKSNTVGLGNDW